MNAIPPLLTLNKAHLRFGARVIFDDISLSLFPRDRACLVGRNGSGKNLEIALLIKEEELQKDKT